MVSNLLYLLKSRVYFGLGDSPFYLPTPCLLSLSYDLLCHRSFNSITPAWRNCGKNFGIPPDGQTTLVCNRANGSYLPTVMPKDLARLV